MRFIIPLLLGLSSLFTLLSCSPGGLQVYAAAPSESPSSVAAFWSTSDELPDSPKGTGTEDFWKDKPMAPKKMNRRLRKQLTLLGTFFGLLVFGAVVFVAWNARRFKTQMPTAAAVFAEQMGDVRAVSKRAETEPQWFTGTHRGHDFAFTVILQRIRSNFDGSQTLPKPTLQLVLGVNCKEPLGVTGNRSTTSRTNLRAVGRGIEDKIRGVPSLLTVSNQLFMTEEQASKLPAGAQEKMVAFVNEHLSLRIRDRHADPVMHALHPELLRDKHVLLGYETWGTRRNAFVFDHEQVQRALDDLVEIAKELEW